jgi:hypothetical protein
MKRVLVAVVASLGVFSAVYGLAASLDVDSKTLGAGNKTVASCQSETLTASYTTEYTTATTFGFKIDQVTVSGVQLACQGKPYMVELVNASGSPLGEVSGTTAAASSFAADFTGQNVVAANVADVHVTITG